MEDKIGSPGCSETDQDSDKNILDLMNMDVNEKEFQRRMIEDAENENHVK